MLWIIVFFINIDYSAEILGHIWGYSAQGCVWKIGRKKVSTSTCSKVLRKFQMVHAMTRSCGDFGELLFVQSLLHHPQNEQLCLKEKQLWLTYLLLHLKLINTVCTLIW
jgi:hypothetical protein